MKYFYLILAAVSIIGAILSCIKGDNLSANLCALSVIVCLGINDILSELKKSNEGVIGRDPKTGRFVRK